MNVLFLCTHNSARSILAEALLNHLGAPLVKAYSAGSSPRDNQMPHPMGLAALEKRGIATADLFSKSWDVFARADAPQMDVIITVCDNAAAEVCPAFADAIGAAPVKVHWGYPDPSLAAGDEDAKRRAFELTRQALGYRFLQLLALPLERLSPAALAAAATAINHS